MQFREVHLELEAEFYIDRLLRLRTCTLLAT